MDLNQLARQGFNAFEEKLAAMKHEGRKRQANPLSYMKPPPMPPTEPDPSYTPRDPINAMGQRLMDVAEDPRNAWIGLGPASMMARVPKMAKPFASALITAKEKFEAAKKIGGETFQLAGERLHQAENAAHAEFMREGKTYYHGTGADVSGGFRMQPASTSKIVEPNTYLGPHFAEDRSVAEEFAGYAKGKGKVEERALNIKNPLYITERELNGLMLAADSKGKLIDLSKEALASNALHPRQMPEFTGHQAADRANNLKEFLKSKGYDGIRYDNELEGGISIIPFDANQIK